MIVAFISRWRFRYFRGATYAGIILAIINTFVFIKIFEDDFARYNLPPELLYILFPLGFITICTLAGYLDELLKLWQGEISHSNEVLNPEMKELMDWARGLKDLRGEMDELMKYIHEKQNGPQEQEKPNVIPAWWV